MYFHGFISPATFQYDFMVSIPPLTVVANKEICADGHEKIWQLIDTKDIEDSRKRGKEYHPRIATEERYRHVKCLSDLTKFISRAFSMVVNQVIFLMLAYNLLQPHLFRQKRKKPNQNTLPHIRQQLLPSDNHRIVYHQSYYGMFRPSEILQFVVELAKKPRKKIA
jgi:hypothetical protein